MFPVLPGQSGYDKRLRKLAHTMAWLIGVLATQVSVVTDQVWLVDSTPVECGTAARHRPLLFYNFLKDGQLHWRRCPARPTRGFLLVPASGARNDELLRFVERFALILADNGMPRMAARVFAFALADDADRYTASELAQGLRVSPAAISGAVRYLVQTGLLGKEREPGSRSDTYRVYDDDVWGAITRHRLPMLDRWADGLSDGLKHLDPTSRGWRRLRETQAYFEFVRDESDDLMRRWAKRRREVLGEDNVRS